VALYLPNTLFHPIAFFGALYTGARVTHLSPLDVERALVHKLIDSGARTLVTVNFPTLLAMAQKLMAAGHIDRLIVGDDATWGSSSIPLAPFSENKRLLSFARLLEGGATVGDFPEAQIDDIALLQYTGGTTGTPKGAMLTHNNITANARQILGIDPWIGQEDRILGVIPFFHIFANMTVLHRTVLRGGEIIMLPRFDADQVLHAMARTHPTSLPGVPTMFRALLEHPDFRKTDMSSLRVCASGGAALPAELKDAFEEASGSIVAEGYGLTECCITASNPYAKPRKVGTIGQPLPDTLFTLVDRDDPTRPPPEGEPGEIVITGPQVMKGYWNRPEDALTSFINGGFRTGDVGQIDEDGFIRIVDRIKDMISVGGFKVYPSQVEAVLYRHPAVREAVVIGVNDPYRGEMPKAFVSLYPDADVDGDALKEWLNPQLGKHERVTAVEVRPDLPKTLVGKLSRKELIAEEHAKIGSAA